MGCRTRRSLRRPGKNDAGAAWISYSDMMAALLLVFVLILCYSIYQYFVMLETKTAELDEKQGLLLSQEALLKDQQSRLTDQQNRLNEQQTALTDKEDELGRALISLSDQQALLDQQTQTLNEQKTLLTLSQDELAQKAQALATAQRALGEKETELSALSSVLAAQRDTLSTQQRRIDDLIGVRTKIIRDLSDTLTQANLKATVDAQTGDIVLESAVFFDTARSTIKESGQTLLRRFIPLYLKVLFRDEYRDYLGEIVIEGHTDTAGTYLMNLKLSQERALSVATFCLEMDTLSASEMDTLRGILTAKGRSYSDPVRNADGSVNMEQSRRVEFKFRLKDAEMIEEMSRILGGDE